MWRLVVLVSIVVKVIAFRDAVRRGVASHWFWIIAFMPAGELIYLAVFKLDVLRDRPKIGGGWGAERRAPIPPRVDRGIDGAQRLYDEGHYQKAEGVLEMLLADEPSHPEALYLLAMTRMQLGDARAATEPLERLVEVKAGHREYAGWKLLAKAHDEAGKADEALKQLERLVDRSPRLEHHVLLAEQLVRMKREDEANEVLLRCRSRKGDREWAERRDALREQLA